MLAGPLLLAAVPAAPAAPDRPAVVGLASGVDPSPGTVRGDASMAVDPAAIEAREEVQASRGRAREAVSPSVAAAPPAPAPPAPAPPAPAAPAPAPPPPAPAPVVTPAPPPPPPAVVGQLWVTTDVNVRVGPSAGTDRSGSLAALAQVGVTGTTADGWTQVVLDGAAGWVKSSYLSATEPGPEAAAAPGAATGSSDAPCGIDPGIERNLSGTAPAVYRAVCAAHGGSVSGFGGYRPGDGGDHGDGRAVDIMVSGPAGWDIAAFLQARAGELGITYLIYEQKIWMAGSPAGAWERMEDRGGATANHFDHVHVSVR